EQWRLSSSRVLNGTLSKIRTDRRQEQAQPKIYVGESISCIGSRRTSEASGGVAADLGGEWSDEARRRRWGDSLDDNP
ncbi:hypothetical protein HID58_072457, partial [Brassica napus]